MKTHRTFLVFTVLLLTLFALTSCTSWDIFRTEFSGIAEFFSFIPVASKASSPVVTTAEDHASAPILKTAQHKETLPSVYVPEKEYTPVADADKIGYTTVPRFSANDLDTVRASLAVHGIEPTLVVRRNPAPAQDVYAIEFAGHSDADAYYINPNCPVTLYVSAQKPLHSAAAEDGSNTVYLTYDDGPTSADTLRLLDILDTYGIKATFFVTGEAVEKSPASARAIVERGHSIGCHSVTHIYDKIYASVEALEEELLGWEEIVTAAGITLDDGHKLFRFPGGSNNAGLDAEKSAEMKEMLTSHFYRSYDWNVVTNDAVLYTAPYGTDTYDYIRDTFQETFAAKVKTGEVPVIILMHETVPETIDLMPWMIETLIANGYTFGTLDEIPSWTFE